MTIAHWTGRGLPQLHELELHLDGCKLSQLCISDALHLASVPVLLIVFTSEISQSSALQSPICSCQLGVYVLHLQQGTRSACMANHPYNGRGAAVCKLAKMRKGDTFSYVQKGKTAHEQFYATLACIEM